MRTITSDRLLLRPWCDDDADFVLDLESRWDVGAVLDDAFSRGLARVLAVTDPANHASQAVCRRLGMTHLGRTAAYYDSPHELFEKLPG